MPKKTRGLGSLSNQGRILTQPRNWEARPAEQLELQKWKLNHRLLCAERAQLIFLGYIWSVTVLLWGGFSLLWGSFFFFFFETSAYNTFLGFVACNCIKLCLWELSLLRVPRTDPGKSIPRQLGSKSGLRSPVAEWRDVVVVAIIPGLLPSLWLCQSRAPTAATVLMAAYEV